MKIIIAEDNLINFINIAYGDDKYKFIDPL